METLINHNVTLQEYRQLKDSDGLDTYKKCVAFFENNQKCRDFCYKDIAELYDLRGKPAKAAEYRAKIKDRSVLKPYVFSDQLIPPPDFPADNRQESEPQRQAA